MGCRERGWKAKRYIIKLADLLAYLRGVVPTWHTKDTQGSNYGYGLAIKEECDRAMVQLYNLARGHALSLGRNYITLDAYTLSYQSSIIHGIDRKGNHI